jgi:hypothetical protein
LAAQIKRRRWPFPIGILSPPDNMKLSGGERRTSSWLNILAAEEAVLGCRSVLALLRDLLGRIGESGSKLLFENLKLRFVRGLLRNWARRERNGHTESGLPCRSRWAGAAMLTDSCSPVMVLLGNISTEDGRLRAYTPKSSTKRMGAT